MTLVQKRFCLRCLPKKRCTFQSNKIYFKSHESARERFERDHWQNATHYCLEISNSGKNKLSCTQLRQEDKPTNSQHTSTKRENVGHNNKTPPPHTTHTHTHTPLSYCPAALVESTTMAFTTPTTTPSPAFYAAQTTKPRSAHARRTKTRDAAVVRDSSPGQ